MRGGTSENAFLVIIPCCSRSSKRCERVRGLMPSTDFSSWPNRLVPVHRSRNMSAVHLLPIIAIADAMQPILGSIEDISSDVFIILYFV